MNPFEGYEAPAETRDGLFDADELGLANRNSGLPLELLARDVTPAGAHYLLTHFDMPLLGEDHEVAFEGAFDAPMRLSMDEIRSAPEATLPVTLECAGNGRAGLSPRAHSMPWSYEAVGTAEWTGTPLAPLIEAARPAGDVVEVAFFGADAGYDKGCAHHFGRSLTMAQLAELDVLLVHSMNGAPLLPQHGAPLRIVVPGWYGMASVKWLTRIEALRAPFDGFQQVRTYRYRRTRDEPGTPITTIRVKSLMVPPGVPDWMTRQRLVAPGRVHLEGRAWSGGGVPVARVEVGVDGIWSDATLRDPVDRYAWTGWDFAWDATEGAHELRCRATDAEGAVQPLEPPWDAGGFANNTAQKVRVHVMS